MNLEKLKVLVDKLVNNASVQEILAKSRAEGREDASQITKNLLKALAGFTFIFGIIGGRTARKIEMVLFLVALLVEMSLAFKHHVVDDPDVQRTIREAWIELEDQSSALYLLARGWADRSMAKFRKKSV